MAEPDPQSAAREGGPLQRAELERLWAWERVMVGYYIVATALILGACALGVMYGETAWVRRSLFGVTLALVAVATVLHLRERCPRCGARLKLKAGVRLTDGCRSCGVAFERPPE